MKIKRILLSTDEYYGHFSGRDFEFDTENLVVVHGPNESGKSTFLNLVRDLLFGIKQKTGYAFEDKSRKMQMRAVLELNTAMIGGSPRLLEIVRRKGNKNVLTGQFENGETVDEARFKKLLDLPDRGEYENVFGFTQAILTDDLKADKSGSLAQALYSTAFRAGEIAELKKQLKDESDSYFSPQGRTKTLNVGIGHIESLLVELELLRVDRNKYAELEMRLESQSQEIEQLESLLKVKEFEKRHLEKLQKSRSHYLALKRHCMQLTQIDESAPQAAGFPIGGETEYADMAAAIAECNDDIDANTELIAQTKLQIKWHKQQCHEGVLKIAIPLHRLANRKSGYDSLVRQLPERREELDTIRENIETLLKRLSPNAQLETTVEQAVTDATIVELQSLQKQAHDVSQVITKHEGGIKLLQSQFVERKSSLKKLAAISQGERIGDDDRRRIELLIADRTQCEILCGKLHDLQTQQNLLNEKIKETQASLLQKLGLAENASIDDMPVLRQFPNERVIREYDEELNSLRKQFESRENQLAEYTEKLVKCELEIAKLDTGSERLPTKEDVRKERENRNHVWRHFRRQYFESNANDANVDVAFDELPTPESYERLVQAADAVADLRFDRVNEVRRFEELLKDRESYTQRIATLQVERQTAQERFELAMAEWLALWPSCNAELIKRPVKLYESRQTWDNWQQMRRQLYDLVTEMERVQSQKADYEQRAAALAVKFPHIGTFGQTLPDGEIAWDVAEIRTLCQSLKDAVDQQTEHQRQTNECRENVAATQSEIEAAQTALASASNRLVEIGQKTQSMATNIGLHDCGNIDEPSESIVESINMLLNGCELVRQIQQEYRKFCREQKQLYEIESQVRQFEDEAATTLQAVTWDADAASLTSVELLMYALPLLEDSEKTVQTVQNLEMQLATYEGVDQTAHEKFNTLQTRRQTLLERVGVTNDESFLQLAAVAAKRRQCAEQMERSQNQLFTILETSDLSPWEIELEQRFADEAVNADDSDNVSVSSQLLLAQIEAETRQLRAKLDQLLTAKGGTDRDLANLRQSDGAAAIAEQVECARQELVNDVNRYVPRLLALRTLEYAIEKFEREQQPETLKQIQRYFAAMTKGRYPRVGVQIGGDGNLMVYENDGREKSIGQLSTGTREQLHLAVRLAYITNFCQSHEPLPIVLDDVLVNFDPPRQLETLSFLGELSKQMQVIFLTCHDATLDMARQAVPTLQVVSL